MPGVDGVYLDWNATAPLLPAARAAWLAAQAAAWGNPASVHAHGQRARSALDAARARIAAALGCRAHELVLTSGGTEANAMVCAAFAAQPCTASAIEHSSILRALPGARLAGVDGEGRCMPERLRAAMADATALVCVQAANNETGVVQPLGELVAAARAQAPGCWIHVDACQAAGKLALDLGRIGADSASIAGHKLGAPKGVGALVVRAGRTLPPLLRGGRQQQDRRSGTEDPALAAALAAALEQHRELGEAERMRQRTLLAQLWADLRDHCPDAVWLGHGAARLPGTMLVARPGRDAEILVQRLDLAGFAVSRGAACMAGRGEPSHVVRAMGVDPELARGALRVSIGQATTAAELAAFAAAYAAESA